MALRWTNIEELKDRLGSLGIAVVASDTTLSGILKGVENTIEQAIRSPVALKHIQDEWRAPVADPRLILRWRPINVADTDAGTANPIVISCATADNVANGLTLTYGTDFVVYDLSEDNRFTVSPMLETIGGVNWGWGRSNSWTGRWTRPPTRLANTLTSDRGRLNVDYWAGWPADAIPGDIVDAAYLEAAAIWYMRKYGRILSSESLNGYSYQTANLMPIQPGMSTKFMSPAAAAMLQTYIMPAVAGISPW